jgi:hypothetical protein
VSRLGVADGLVLDEYERQVRQLVEERALIQELLGEMEAHPSNVLEFPTEGTWAGVSLDERRNAVQGVVQWIVVSPSKTQGGRHDRGIDFDSRVKFDLRIDDRSTAAAIGKVLFDAIDWSGTAEATEDGISVAISPDVAEALEASPFARTDLLLP